MSCVSGAAALEMMSHVTVGRDMFMMGHDSSMLGHDSSMTDVVQVDIGT